MSQTFAANPPMAILFRMAAGFPGTPMRLDAYEGEAQEFDPTAPFSAFGVPVKIGPNGGKIQPWGAGDTLADLYGMLVRHYPGSATTDPLGTSTPPSYGEATVQTKGYQMVVVNGATPCAKGGQVYLRIAAAAAGKPIGGIEAAADSTNTLAPPGWQFMGTSDANGNTEIRFSAYDL